MAVEGRDQLWDYSNSPFSIITSLRFDPGLAECDQNKFLCEDGDHNSLCLYMSLYHVDRLVSAFQELIDTGNGAVSKGAVETCRLQVLPQILALTENKTGPLKIRVVVSLDGHVQVTASNVPSLPLQVFFPQTLDLVLEDAPRYTVFVSPLGSKASFFTRHKTTRRGVYDEIQALVPSTSADGLSTEVLLVNESGKVMEGAITTPYFRMEGVWKTPSSRSGGNRGVTRRWALEKGLSYEADIPIASLSSDECAKVVLSNGVRGFSWGWLQR